MIVPDEEETMSNSTPHKNKLVLSEDWLSVVIAFVLMILALLGLIGPGWMKF
jgi:hypothetical protein